MYNQNLKPIVSVPATVAPFKLKDENSTPVVTVPVENSAFTMPTNGVTDGSSTRLQNANRLPGRVSMSPSHIEFGAPDTKD